MDKQNTPEPFIKSLKNRTIFPFYIANVNQKFFIDLLNHDNKTFLKRVLPKLNKELKPEDMAAIRQIENLTKPEKILRMINQALTKIVAFTGTKEVDLFDRVGIDEFKKPLFIKSKANFADLEIIGDIHEDRRFSYSIYINKKSYLFSFVEQIQFAFYLDHETNRVSGGFSLNRGNAEEDIAFDKSVEDVFVNYAIKKFLKSQLYPLSLDNILNISYDIKKSINKNKKKNKKNVKNSSNDEKDLSKIIDFENLTIDDLKLNWEKLIERKYLKFNDFSEERKSFYKDQLFFSMMIIILIMLYLLQEINIYFTSKTPELILSLLDKPIKIRENADQSYAQDFDVLIDFLYRDYQKKFSPNNIRIKDIKNAEDFIKIIPNYVESDSKNVVLGDFISTFEVLPVEKLMILNKSDFLDNVKFRTFFVMLLLPEIYSVGINNPVLIEYLHLKNIIKNNKEIKTSDALLEDINESICELNYDYTSFISNDAIVILKNNEPLYANIENQRVLITRDENRRIYNNYFWAEIYIQSKIAEKNSIELKVNKIINTENKKKTFIFKEALKNLDDLQFDWYDHFYGLPQIKKIVKKIDDEDNLKNSVDILSKKIKQEDAAAKKSWERGYITYAFLTAIIIGLVDFISMVFTILPNSGKAVSMPILYGFIGIGCIFALILIAVFVVSVITITRTKKRFREIDRKRN